MSKKHPLLQKQIALISFLSKILIKNSLRSCPYLVKKTSILSNLHIMTTKVKRMSFFRIFHEKKIALMPIYFQKKKRPFSKKTLLSCPYFVEEMSILSETLCSYVNFFQNFHQKPLAVMPIFDQKHQFYQSTL